VCVERVLAEEGTTSEPEIGDDEIRIPVVEEEIRLRKEVVEEEEIVEEDVRKEEIDIDETERRDRQGRRLSER
jgi:stress response protein YsnF